MSIIILKGIIKIMQSGNKKEKNRKNYKSADKKTKTKKNELDLYFNRDMEDVFKSPGSSFRYHHQERFGARSQQSSRKSQRKYVIHQNKTFNRFADGK